MSEPNIVARTITELPPCALQFHPVDTSLIVIGTYKLEESTKTRHGTLDFYRYSDGQLSLVKSHATRDSSILDIKINVSNPWVITTAQSTGSIIVWQIDSESLDVVLKTQTQIVDDPEILVLSINFSVQDKSVLSATLSDGSIYVCRQEQDGSVKVLHNDLAMHEAEAWTSSFGTGDVLGSVLFSGGDDSVLMAHDLRAMDSGAIWKSRKIHDGGVTSILPYGALSTGGVKWTTGESPYQLLTGGYDDCLKSVELRMISDALSAYAPPRVVQQTNLGGGVWRLVPGPESTNGKLAVCCMYDGARIVDPKVAEMNSEEGFIVRSIKRGHESMVYGTDWSPDGKYVATCSFYDKAVQVWEA